MSLNLGTLHATVDLDTQAYNDGMNSLPGTAESAMRKVAAYSATYLSGRALFSFGKEASMEFSKMEEGANKLKYVYTEIGASAKLAAKDLEDTFGLANQTAANMVANIGDLLTGFGFQQAKSLEMARQVAERGIDVASFKGLDQEQVVANMTAALTGNTETLKSMGVVVNQNSKEFTDMVKQIQDTTGATEQQAKAQAILNEIMRQTKNAAGDYLRPEAPRTYAQVLGDLNQQVMQFKANLGGDIVPITQPLLDGARGLLKAYNDLEPANRRLVQGLALMGVTIAAMQSPIAKSINAKLIEAKLSLQNIKLYDYEAAAKEASENRKLAAINKRIAAQDALMAKEKLKAAKDAEEQASLVRIGARSIVASKNGSATREDIEKLRKAEADYAQAVKNTQAAEAGRARATAHAAAMRRQAIAATRDAAIAQEQLTTAQTAGGRASLFLSRSITAAATSLKAFFASMGPIGWFLLAIQGVTWAINLMNASSENAARKAEENLEKSTAAREKLLGTMRNEVNQLKRLEQLVKYENLNNKEMQEAQGIIEALGLSQDMYVKRLDEITGRLILQKKSMQELIAEKKKMMIDEQLNGRQDVDENGKPTGTRSGGVLKELEDTENKFTYSLRKFIRERSKSNDAAAVEFRKRFYQEVNNSTIYRINPQKQQELYNRLGFELFKGDFSGDVLENYNKIVELRKEVAALKAGKLDIKESTDEAKTVNEARRKARDAYENKEWQAAYNQSAYYNQLEMLNSKINQLKKQLRANTGNKPYAEWEEDDYKLAGDIRDLERKAEEVRKSQKNALKQIEESEYVAWAFENAEKQLEAFEIKYKNLLEEHKRATNEMDTALWKEEDIARQKQLLQMEQERATLEKKIRDEKYGAKEFDVSMRYKGLELLEQRLKLLEKQRLELEKAKEIGNDESAMGYQARLNSLEKEALELAQKRKRLEYDIAEEKKRQKEIWEERLRQDSQWEQQRADIQFQQIADNTIARLVEKGNYNAAEQTARNLFEAAQKAAENLKNQYYKLRDQKGPNATQEEVKQLNRAREAMIEAEERRQRAENKVREVDRERRQPRDNADRAVITTTASLFQQLTGAGNIAERQLRATEEGVNELRKLNETTLNGGTYDE